jgi:Holliday junction resolvase RusA-like endonuclease
LVKQYAKAKWDMELVSVYKDLPVSVELIFARKLPNKCFVNDDRNRELKQQVMAAFQQNRVADRSTPDVDNLSKFVLDALQGLIYDEDNQVVKCTATKVVDSKPPHNGRIFFSVRPANTQDFPPVADSVPGGLF